MTSIVLLDPFRALMSHRNAMNMLFEETVGQPGSPFAALASPAIDLYQTPTKWSSENPCPASAPRT